MYSFRTSFWMSIRTALGSWPFFSARATLSANQRWAVEWDALEQHLHVRERIDGDPNFAHLSAGVWVIRVEAELRRQIQRDRKPRLAGLQQVFEPRVGLLGRSEAGVLPHDPRPLRVHPLGDPPSERRLAGRLRVAGSGCFHLGLPVDRSERDPRAGLSHATSLESASNSMTL